MVPVVNGDISEGECLGAGIASVGGLVLQHTIHVDRQRVWIIVFSLKINTGAVFI